jgi:hypothetical protein
MTIAKTRAEAVEIVGEALVAKAERENAEYTNRVGANGNCQRDDIVEFSAFAKDQENTLRLIYHIDADEHDEYAEDLSALDWDPAAYIINE